MGLFVDSKHTFHDIIITSADGATGREWNYHPSQTHLHAYTMPSALIVSLLELWILSVCLSVCLSVSLSLSLSLTALTQTSRLTGRKKTQVTCLLSLSVCILPERYFCTGENLFRHLVVASGILVFPRAYVFIFCFICSRNCHISLFFTSVLGLSRFSPLP